MPVSDVSFTECKALGIKWSVATDQLYFLKNISSSACDVVSKRSMLKIVTSIFDPLGLICPLILQGRLLFQEATKLCNEWDEPVPPKCADNLHQLALSLMNLEEIKIPRCIQPARLDDAVCELHIFSDASNQAYGACAYIRHVTKNAYIHSSPICGQSKVAPIKPVTIPRLELQAAVLAAHMHTNLIDQMDI